MLGLPNNWRPWVSLALAGLVSLFPVLPSLKDFSLFGALTAKATPLLWDGEASDGVWSNPVNWQDDTLPTDQDIAIFSQEIPFPATIDGQAAIGGLELADTFVGEIVLAPGASLHIGSDGLRQAGGRIRASGGQVTVDGSFHLAGGEFVAPAGILKISGNISILQEDYFKHNAGTVALSGVEQVVFGSTTFNNFTKIALVDQTLEFQSGKTFAFDGKLSLHGAPDSPLKIRSSTAGEPALFDPRGPIDVGSLDLKDVINIQPETIACATCHDSGNLSGWELPQIPSPSSPPGEINTATVSPSPSISPVALGPGGSDFAAGDPALFRLEIPTESATEVELTPLGSAVAPAPESPATGGGLIPDLPENLKNIWQYVTGRPAEAASESPRLLETTVVDSTGQEVALEPTLTEDAGSLLIRLDPPANHFRPGKYTLGVKAQYGGRTLEGSQDFTWGVLALNTNQDRYLPREEAQLQFGVLSDSGATVCNAALELQVTSPSGNTQTLSTENGAITRADTCNLQIEENIAPDYAAKLALPEAGTWQLRLTATLEAGARTIEDEIIVDANPPIIVARQAATRLWPFAPSPVTITIQARQDFIGTITESVPADFEITNWSGTAVSDGTRKLLTTEELILHAGETTTLTYTYDAPDVSPEFYLLGPIKMATGGTEGLSELRAWQVAADADTAVDTSTNSGHDLYTNGQQGGVWGPYWTSTTTAYVFYRDLDGGGNPVIAYSKTTNGGTSWSAATSVSADNIEGFAVWYDQHTTGDTGTKIHVAWVDGLAAQYRSLDTNGDTLGTETTVKTMTGSEGRFRVGIVKARGGNLYVQFSNVAAAAGHDLYRSTDGGANWTDRVTGHEDQSDGDSFLMFPGSETDNQDIWMIYWDFSADEISLKVYDNSADSWAETSISTGMVESLVSSTPGGHNMSGAQRDSDDHVILAAWNGFDTGTDDLKVWDIASSASITAKTDVVTDTDDAAYANVFINQQNDNLYVSYVGISTETILTDANLYYKKSTDGGATWDLSATQMNENAIDDLRVVHAGHSVADNGGYFMPFFFNDDLNDVFVNTTNAVAIAAVDKVTGTVYTDEGSTNIGANITVSMCVNGGLTVTSDDTDSSGAYSIAPAGGFASGDVLTLYIDDETQEAVTVTVTDGSALSGVDLYRRYLITRHDNAGSLTNSNLDTADNCGGVGDADISDIYSIASSNLTVQETNDDGETELLVWTGDTFAPGGNIDVNNLDINGTLTMSTNDAEVIGSWDATGGTFTTSGDVLLKGKGEQVVTSNSNSFNNLYKSDGLIGYWKLDEGSGTSAADTSGYFNTGTLTNMEAGDWNSSSASTNFTNPYGLDFDGTDEFVDMDDASDYDFTDTADFTISGWFNRDTATSDDVIVAKANALSCDPCASAGYVLYLDDSTDKLTFFATSAGVGNYLVESTSTFTATGWNHFTFVWDQDSPANTEIYINGVDDNATDTGTIGNIGSLATALDFRLADDASADGPFDGRLDDIRVYDRVLTPQEIQTLALGNQPATTRDASQLEGYWKLDDSLGTSANDSSGNANVGTLTNMEAADWDTTTKASLDFTNTASLDFDGTDEYVTVADSAELDVADAADLTISAWFNRDTFTTDDVIVAKRNGIASTDAGYMAYIDDSTDKVTFEISDGTDEYQLESTTTFTATGWKHVTIVWDEDSAANSEIYINGVDDNATDTGTIGDIGDASNSVALAIASESDAANYFDGHLDDLRVYSRTLTLDEIGTLGVSASRPGTMLLEDTLDVNGDFYLGGGYLDTKSGENNSITPAEIWENNGGVFVPQTGTVTFNGTSGTHELQTGGQSFYNQTVSGSGGTWTMNDRLDVNNTYTQSNGTVSTSSSNYAVHAVDFDQTGGTFTPNSSQLTLDGTSAQTVNFDDAQNEVQVEDATETSLVGYWKLDEGQDVTARDSSATALNGTLQNTPSWSETVNSTTTYDNPYSLDFDGSNDYVLTADNASLDSGDTADFTIAGWFNRDTATSDDTILAKRAGTAAGDIGYIVWLDATNDKINVEVSDGTNEYSVASTTAFTSTGWNHFAVVWDQDSAANTEIYVNGTDDNGTDTGTIGNVGDISNTIGVAIGAESDGGVPFDGKLDDIRVYSAALSSTQITDLAAGKYADGDSGTATFTLNTALDANDDLFFQAGILDASSTNCASATCSVTVGANWNNYAGSSAFTARTGTVTLDGTNQTINSSNTFYNLTKQETSNDATDATLTIQISTTQTVSNTFNLDGLDANDELAVKSSTNGTRHTWDVTGAAATANYLDVRDSNASTNNITCTNCTNTSNNDDAEATPHWIFSATATRMRPIIIVD